MPRKLYGQVLESESVPVETCPLCTARQRQQDILRLRGQGKTFREIGEQFGMTRQSIFRAYKRAQERVVS